MMPPLHGPGDRELMARVGDWEIRRHADEDPRTPYLADRALLHLQLWNPIARISILTPSRLTGGRFEIAGDARRSVAKAWTEVTAQLSDLQLPSAAEIGALTLWLVVRSEIAARRRRRGGA